MRFFKLDPDGFREVRRKALIRTIPLVLIALAVGIYTSTGSNHNGNPSTLWFLIPVMLIALGIGLYRGISQQKKGWDTFQLTIEEDLIVRTQHNTPTVNITKSQIGQIVETKEGHFQVKGVNNSLLIYIPSAMKEREALYMELGRFGPIQKQEAKRRFDLTIPSSLGALGLMGLFFSSMQKWVVIPTGLILTVGLIWSFIFIQKSKLINKSIKRSAYFIFLVLLSIVSKLLMVMGVFGPLK